MKKKLFLVFLVSISNILTAQNSSSLVYMDGGKLAYNTYAMQNQTNSVNVLPDFSFAGYKGGGVAIPNIPVVVTITPKDGDRKQDIQDAIDQVSAMPLNSEGFRGAILLKAGLYNVSGELLISTSGVVIKGEGQSKDGTVLKATLTTEHNLINIEGVPEEGEMYTLSDTSLQKISDSYLPVGGYTINIENATSYNVGDIIFVRRTPNQFWIDDLGMDRDTLCETKESCVGWDPNEYAVEFERKITAISGNTITIDLPIVDVIETKYGGGEILKATSINRISNCGIENMRIESVFSSNTDENHMYFGIDMIAVENSWVTDVTTQYMRQGCVRIQDFVRNVTVQNSAAIDHKSIVTGGRRYSFPINGRSVANLIQRCYTKSGRHDYVNGSRVPGPNVYLDCYATDTKNDIGPHHRWTTGMLYDNVRGGQIRVRNRGKSGTGHGWVGNTVIVWNNISDKDGFVVQSPKGGKNFGIGCVGGLQWGNGFWELGEQPVTPRSLYLQQLQDRLGNTAVEKVTLPEQLTGNIGDLLINWQGNGSLVSLSSLSSTAFSNQTKSNLTIYPIPSKAGILNIDNIEGNYDYQIINTIGVSVKKGTVANNFIDTSALKPGVYFLSLSNENNVTIEKIIIE